MITRRGFFRLIAGGLVGGLSLGGYAFAIEPRFRLIVKRYELALPSWPKDAKPLRIAILTDFHTCEPWMPVSRVAAVVERTRELEPDIVVLLGDYTPGLRWFRSRAIAAREWLPLVAELKPPLGIHAVLGNHDWWEDVDAVRDDFAATGLPLYENDAVKITKDGHSFWLIGLGDQLAYWIGPQHFRGVDDLPGALARLSDDDPAILLAHEPDIFVDVPDRVALTLSGHTHGGQVFVPGLGRPVVPSAYGQRFAYGHIVETGRHMIVSSGLGCSTLPVRFLVPPEITMVTVRALSDQIEPF